MSDKDTQDGPPMATIEEVLPPRRTGSSRGSGVMIILAAVLLGVLLALALRPAKLDVYKTIDELAIADTALAACIKDTAAANQWPDVGHIVSLRCNHPNGEPVKSLAGIEHLVALVDVNLAFNAISDASPLAELPRLAVIDLSHNQLSDLPVFRAAGNLERLELNYNQFESLDWLNTQHFTILQSLSVAHNHLTTVAELASLEALRQLNVRNNRLADVTPIFGLGGLELLDIGSNALTTLDGFSAFGEMRRLFLDGNRLSSSAGIVGMQWLEELDLSGNPLGDVEDVGNLQRLQRLDLSETGIRSLAGILTLGDLEVLRVHGDPGLPCEEIASAIREFGAAAVRHDTECVPEG